jgi:hypothetical protein
MTNENTNEQSAPNEPAGFGDESPSGFDDYIVGPGAFMGVKGRFLFMEVNRTEAEQRNLLRAMAASKEELTKKRDRGIAELEALLHKYNPFDLIANVFIANAFCDPETYEEPLFEGRIAFVEYLTLLLLTQSPDSLSWESTQLVDGPTLTDIQTRLEDLFSTTIWLFMVTDFDPEEPTTPTDVDQLRFKALTDSLIVRFPAYRHHMRDILNGLFASLEGDLLSVLGFTISDALRLTDAISDLVTSKFRTNGRAIRSEVQRLRKAVEKYRRRKQGTKGIPFDTIKTLAKVPPSQLKSELELIGTAAALHRIGEVFVFSAEDLSRAAKVDLDRATSFLTRLSVEFGCVDRRYRYPAPTHPLMSRPFVRHGRRYICPVPQSLEFSLRYSIESYIKPASSERLVTDSRYWKRYEEARSRFTETTAIGYLTKCLRHASAYQNLSYDARTENGELARVELDGLIVFDTVIFLVESKSGTLSLPARRGGIVRMKEEMKELVEHAYHQGLRAKRFIQENARPVFIDGEGREVVIDKNSLDKIFLITVTLESLDVFVTALYQLKGLGLFGSEELPWAVSLPDLRVICEMIEFPSQFIHYLERRKRINEIARVIAHDELDWLGHYLKEGLYFDDMFEQGDAPTAYNLLHYSTDFDSYYLYETGQRRAPVEKPRQTMPAICRKLLNELETHHPIGYSRACGFILDLSDESREQFSLALDSQITRTKADNCIHDFTMITESTKSGITIMFSRSERSAEMRDKLTTYCALKKYQTKCDLWIGIGICVDRPDLMDCLITTRFEWKEDQEFGQVVDKALRPIREMAKTPAEMSEMIARMAVSPERTEPDPHA